MSRFNNVKVLLDATENYNLKEMVEVLDIPCSHLGSDEYEDDLHELAEDLAFVLISMWALVPVHSKDKFKNSLTDEMVDLEIRKMFPNEE